MWTLIKSDYSRYKSEFSIFQLARLFLVHPGFKAVCFLRFQQQCVNLGFWKLANQIRILMISKFGFDCVVGNQIGPGLKIEHPVGIVIGGSVRAGKNLTILQNSTIGERYIDDRSTGKCPILRDDILICANVQIIGDIDVANGTRVLGGSILLRSTTPGEKIVGVTK